MSTVQQRCAHRMKRQALQRAINRTFENMWQMTYQASGLPDMRAEVDKILAPFNRPRRRPLRLTRTRP